MKEISAVRAALALTTPLFLARTQPWRRLCQSSTLIIMRRDVVDDATSLAGSPNAPLLLSSTFLK